MAIPSWLRNAWLVIQTPDKKPAKFKDKNFAHWKEVNFWNYFNEKDLEEATGQNLVPAIWPKASKILALDIDSPETVKKFNEVLKQKASDTLIAAINATYIERTPNKNGVHIFFKLQPDAENWLEQQNIGAMKFGDAELLYDHLVTVWSAADKNLALNYSDKLAYISLQQLKELINILQELSESTTQKTTNQPAAKILEPNLRADPETLAKRLAQELEKYYVKGQRHCIVVAILGALWQYGYDEETRVKTIEKLVKLLNDEEAKQRIYQAKYHNEDRLKQLLQNKKQYAVENYLIKHCGFSFDEAKKIGQAIRRAVAPTLYITAKHLAEANVALHPESQSITLELLNGLLTVEIQNPFKITKDGVEININKFEKALLFRKAILSKSARKWLEKNWKLLLAKAEVQTDDIEAELLRVIDQEGMLIENAEFQDFITRKYPIIDERYGVVYFLGERLRDIAMRYGYKQFRRAYSKPFRRTMISIQGNKINVYAFPFSNFGDIIWTIIERKQNENEGENE